MNSTSSYYGVQSHNNLTRVNFNVLYLLRLNMVNEPVDDPKCYSQYTVNITIIWAYMLV